MINANLKLALRNIVRNKLYTAINVVGLGIASAFCILLYFYVKNEQSFDSFHKDEGQLYRLEVSNHDATLSQEKPKKGLFSFMIKDDGQQNMIVTPPVLAVDLKRNFPEIQDAIRFEGLWHESIRANNKSFKETDNLTYTDADFFQVFNFPLLSGNSKTVLSGANSAAISERLAKKYFGNDNPVGKTLSFPNQNNLLFTISGVFRNMPHNSSFQYDLILPILSDPDYKERINNGLQTFNMPLVLKINRATDVTTFKQKIDAFAKTYFKTSDDVEKKNGTDLKDTQTHLFLRPLAEAHYNQSRWGILQI